MSRALGLHRVGELVHYALVDATPGQPPEVLAAGRAGLDELVGLHGRLSGERPLVWGIAEESGGRRLEALRADWPLQRPPTRASLHPAAAAALWEWELGRVQEEDLFVWLRPERLHWSSGEPGSGPAGTVPRRGPLRDAVRRLQQDAHRSGAPAALAADGDAPGAAVVEEVLRAAGFRTRRVRRAAQERGVDRAAAGAALGALDPLRPGVFAPRRTRSREPALWRASMIAATAVGAAALLDRTQSAHLEALRRAGPPGIEQSTAQEPGTPAARVPEELRRILDRQASLRRGLDALLEGAPEGRLEELQLLTGPGSSRAQARLRLLPGGEGVDDAGWLQASGAEVLDLRSLADGTVVARADFEALDPQPPAAPPAAAPGDDAAGNAEGGQR